MAMLAMSMLTIPVGYNLSLSPLFSLYASLEMNLSHIITELSFGPFFPEIVQPLDDSYESTDQRKS